MCGRYTLEEVIRVLDRIAPGRHAAILREWDRKYPNIPPGTVVPIIRLAQGAQEHEATTALWKLVPPWARDPKQVSYATINARSESVREKPSFSHAWQQGQRCLIPASGWYEFPEVSKGKKQPVYFSLPDKQPFCFAGIWEHWQRPVGEHEEITSMAILTCEPNATVARYHDRMPVMVAPENYQAWLDPESDVNAAYQLLHPASQTLPLTVWPVTPRVGNVRYQADDCTTPITPEPMKSQPPKPQQLDLF